MAETVTVTVADRPGSKPPKKAKYAAAIARAERRLAYAIESAKIYQDHIDRKREELQELLDKAAGK